VAAPTLLKEIRAEELRQDQDIVLIGLDARRRNLLDFGRMRHHDSANQRH
jgi:hypothetical protein